ncbi:hypothetical protein IIA15_11315 [candidate division TA06 bacterium]|nr:hypothetical protein [candidate division TA06 bacterium]
MDLTYSFRSPFEVYGMGLGIQNRDWLSNFSDYRGFGDIELGMKIGKEEAKLFQIGVMGYGILPTGKDGFSNGSSQWGGRGLMTFDLSKREGLAPLRFHGNIGYNGYNRGREDELLLGLGIELPTPLFTPMIELTSEQDLDHSFFENPIRFTSGIRFLTPFGPVFDLGYDVNLSKENGLLKIEPHDWSLLLGIQFETSLQLFTPNTGTITGKVTDSETGEPLSASLVLLREEGIDEGSDPKTGLFTFKKIGPGLKTLQVTLKGYKRKILPVFVKRGDTTVRDVSLVKSEEPIR